MNNKYTVRLTDSERSISQAVVSKLSSTSQKVRQAQILLKADHAAAAWTDAKIADAYSCCAKTVENIRQRFVAFGFDETLNRKNSSSAGTKKLLNGNQEAKVIAMRLGSPPKCYGKWTLRLLAPKSD